MLHYIVLSGILIRLCLGFEIQLLENLEWFTANRTCSETLSGGLLTPSDALMNRSLEIATPTSQNYWSDKKATITDFIQFEGCFNSSNITKRETLLPWQHPITACFELCENTTRIGLMTKDKMEVDCECLGEEDITSSRENISQCFMPCPNDAMMNTCGNFQLMSVYNRLDRQEFDAPSLRNMAQCVAVTTDDMGAVSLQFDDCQDTNDGYICEICDAEQCSQKVVQEDTAVTWQEAQQACQNQGGYLGNFGSAKAKTIWTGHRRWLLEDRYSVFGTFCLMCNYTNGILRSACQYTNCSEERPSLCIKDSEKIPVRSWFEARNFCTLSSSRLLNGEELYEKKVNDSIYISHYYWTNGVANYTPYVRAIGCFDISNSSGMIPLNHTTEGPGRDCIQQCQTTDYFGLTTDGMALQCFCLEHSKNLSRLNTTECMMSCTQEKDDLCSGDDGRLIVYEIDRNSVGSSILESEMECLSLRKQMDFLSMDSTDCLQNATGYICEICDIETNNCTQEYHVGSYNWFEASMECRDKGGNLGNLIDYYIMVGGIYWFGGRRWRVEQNNTEDAVPSDSIACQRCRINNGQLQCNYAGCNGDSLPGMCLGGIIEAKTTLTTDAVKEESTSTYDVTQHNDQMPPKMNSSFNNAYFYPQNTTLTAATINCTAINGQIKYEWKKDGDVIKNNKYVSVNISTGTLRFVQMHDADYGTYQCFATNDHGTAISKPFTVNESKLLPFPSSEVKEVKCTQYEHCKIPCRDKPPCVPYSQCRVVWKIREGTDVKLTKRVGVDSNGDLHLLWSNTNDWTGLAYMCGVWQEQMNKWVRGSETYLRIVQATQTPEIRPFRVFCKNGTALNGENGVLSCMFAGYPAPEVEWISPTNMTIRDTPGKYEISDFGRVLTILQAEPEFEGDYICKGKGKESDACSVFLNVTSAPILKGDNQMKDITVSIGENATFLCNVSSLPMELPPSPPKWKKNGMDLDIDGGKYMMFDNNRVLTVTDVQNVSDTGVYQCMSENSEGVLLEEAILMVNVSRQTPSDNQKTVAVNVIIIFVAVAGSIILIVLIGIGICLVKRRINRHRKGIYSPTCNSERDTNLRNCCRPVLNTP